MKKQLQLLVFILPLAIFSQTQLGINIDGENWEDRFGSSASISGDGTVVAIGASNNGGNGAASGHVRVFQFSGGAWLQLGSDIDGEAPSDQSGRAVSLSNDGFTVAIGTPFNDGNGTKSGHVRVYQFSGGSWSQLGVDIDGVSDSSSGDSISMSGDGTIVAIGANSDDGNGTNSGHVRVYQYNGGTWSKLGGDIDGETAGDLSGASVSLSNDGSTVVIGALYNDGNGIDAGHVRIYRYSGGTWSQLGDDIDGEAANDRSGSVSISSDGNIVAVGSFLNDGNGNASGSVRVFQYSGGSWSQLGGDIDGEAADSRLGEFVAISANGSIVATGAPSGDNYVQVFQYIGGVWSKAGSNIDVNASSAGTSVSLSNDGSKVAFGAPSNLGGKGSAYVFDVSGVILSSNEYVLSKFSMYPNPVKSQFNIELKDGLELQKANVYNNLGQLVATETKPVIRASNFADGLYYVEIITNKGKATKKIAVKK
ncbi:T9SS type A sorting domain-containing protein [Pontimicrobium sp. SW4]|uniref:T9SS type A sorting domain-containing protein n=1 Tax=Pontimicrobium sp. SW4 TaxID=3153519 RepID=A0AAU7BRF6_9FLAO